MSDKNAPKIRTTEEIQAAGKAAYEASEAIDPNQDVEDKKKMTVDEGRQRIKEIDSAQNLDKMEDLKIPTRRVKMLMVNPADFMFLFTKGLVFRKRTRIISGVPEDAKLIALAADSARNGVMLVVESETYDEVPINVLPPVQVVEIDTRTLDDAKKKKATRKKK
jgi:hypothetical protein